MSSRSARSVRAAELVILNAPTLAALLLAAAQAVLGAVVCALVVRHAVASRTRSVSFAGGGGSADGIRGDGTGGLAVFLPAAALSVAALLSIPLLYAVLASYVSQWEGAVCVAGVLRIGTESVGTARLLPSLLGTAAAAKAAAVLAACAWAALHAADRKTLSGSLGGAAAKAAGALGAFAAAGGIAEAAYLLIEKREQHLFTGCCTTAAVSHAPSATDGTGGALLFGVMAAAAVSAAWAARRAGRARNVAVIASVAVAAVAGATFFAGPLAAAVAGVDGHACAHCLATGAPASLVGLGLVAAAVVAAISAAVVALAGRRAGDRDATESVARGLLRFAGRALPAAVVAWGAVWLLAGSGA